jgi:hypothetical protein
MIRRLIIGRNSTEQCINEIQIKINLTHPDFLRLDGPCEIDEVDKWLTLLRTAPILNNYRYGLLTNAHQLSEQAITRLLDIAEDHSLNIMIWIASQTELIRTIHSRFHVLNNGDLINDEWDEILRKCSDRLCGSCDSAAWEKWSKVSKLYMYSSKGVMPHKCIVEARNIVL